MLVHIFIAVMALICIYTVRHYCFTVNRVLGRQRHPYVDIETADWPTVTTPVVNYVPSAISD